MDTESQLQEVVNIKSQLQKVEDCELDDDVAIVFKSVNIFLAIVLVANLCSLYLAEQGIFQILVGLMSAELFSFLLSIVGCVMAIKYGLKLKIETHYFHYLPIYKIPGFKRFCSGVVILFISGFLTM